jgi:hypothetical protein
MDSEREIKLAATARLRKGLVFEGKKPPAISLRLILLT